MEHPIAKPVHDSITGESYFTHTTGKYYLLKEDEYRKLQELLNVEGD